MEDIFGTEIKVGDKVAHFSISRYSSAIYIYSVEGFTKQMVRMGNTKHSNIKAYPGKLMIVNDDARFVVGKTKWI